MFFIDLRFDPNNKQIYEVKHLLNYKVVFEAPMPKRQIPQCATCQRYGHIRGFCFRKPRCVKCVGDHATSNCQRKGLTEYVKCILCGGNHPANYKGCSVYKDLQKAKYPPLRPKNTTTNNATIKPQLSYAEATGSGS